MKHNHNQQKITFFGGLPKIDHVLIPSSRVPHGASVFPAWTRQAALEGDLVARQTTTWKIIPRIVSG